MVCSRDSGIRGRTRVSDEFLNGHKLLATVIVGFLQLRQQRLDALHERRPFHTLKVAKDLFCKVVRQHDFPKMDGKTYGTHSFRTGRTSIQ